MRIKVYSAREVFWTGFLGGIFLGVLSYHADHRTTHDATLAGYVLSCLITVAVALPVTAGVNRLAAWRERRRARRDGRPTPGPPAGRV